jgi:acyl carrier protein
MMNVEEDIKTILADTLSLGDRKMTLTAATPLFGNIAELDSMAVISVITAIQDHFGIAIEDDEFNQDIFMTLGNLSKFVEQKLSS